MNIGQRIIDLRISKGISRNQLAKAIGYGQTIIIYWEKGERVPASDAIIALAKYFDVSADYLLGLKDE